MKQQEQGQMAGFEEEYLCYADASFFVCLYAAEEARAAEDGKRDGKEVFVNRV